MHSIGQGEGVCSSVQVVDFVADRLLGVLFGEGHLVHAAQGLRLSGEVSLDSCVHSPCKCSPRLLNYSLCCLPCFPCPACCDCPDTVTWGQEEHIISVSRDGALKVWDHQGVELTSIPAHPGPISQCAAVLEPRPGTALSAFPLHPFCLLLFLFLFFCFRTRD